MSSTVTIRREVLVLPTYAPAAPDRYPQFLDHRVYQGSSGRVYPLPVIDRVESEARPRAWKAVWVENAFLSVLILPELGGRIHRIVDKRSGADLIYHQPVIKPALVGLAGPWVSGGIEFNWPQHHRPSTTMPAEVEIEHMPDDGVTVWLSEHDPMARMKGMHGVCLRPDIARLELRARAYNRTDDVQTFLWWANVGLEAHEQYQSFFPPDVAVVADHAKRAMSAFPLARGRYYGVDYGARGANGVPAAERPRLYSPIHDADAPGLAPGAVACAPNDLSWYANIPVPTSYMCVGTSGDFCGGYDHRARVGLVHVANHHISPGKKQWTWGNHEFGYAWDRNLTDARPDGSHPPYIELMAGVYTDNQPDFSYLQPGETKHWTQYWYPIHEIGVPRAANPEAAGDLRVLPPAKGRATPRLELRLAVVRDQPDATVELIDPRGARRWHAIASLAPGAPFVRTIALPRGADAARLHLVLRDAAGTELLRFTPPAPSPAAAEPPPPATAPVAPEAMASADELYLTGLHLEQYRHATRCATAYWREALRRDPGDSRCHLALGRWFLRRGEWTLAERHLRASVARLTALNPNPADGEAHYQLGRCLRLLGRADEAYAAFYKSTWNQGWAAAAYHALAELDSLRGDPARADEHLERALRLDADNLRARNLRAALWRRAGRVAEADACCRATLALDPLDAGARWQRGDATLADNQMRLDVAHDYARAGFWSEALAVLAFADPRADDGSAPLVAYTEAWLATRAGDAARARRAHAAARRCSADRCFPARLEEQTILRDALAHDAADARAHALLGHWLYNRRRRAEAIVAWEAAARLNPHDAVVWRCLGMAYYNHAKSPSRARRAYERAIAARPDEARLIYERDQLWKRLGVPPRRRLRVLAAVPALVRRRDDLVLELARLHNQLGAPDRALDALRSRAFQPWEGGEGEVLGQYVRAHVRLGRAALRNSRLAEAREHFEAALSPPENLGEARHPLANPAEVHWWLGEVAVAAGDRETARRHWRAAADFKGDFQDMSVRSFSATTAYSARALARLGRHAAARALFRALLKHAEQLERTPAEVDYFATSLPTLLLFDDDLDARQLADARFMAAQARAGLGEPDAARALLADILRRDPNHALAADLADELT